MYFLFLFLFLPELGSYQMYARGSVVRRATPPEMFTNGQKVRNFASIFHITRL